MGVSRFGIWKVRKVFRFQGLEFGICRFPKFGGWWDCRSEG